jgi:hypothetical protein
MKMTYKELVEWLRLLTDTQLEMNVTILNMDINELYPAYSIGILPKDDRIDEGQPIIFI